MKKTTIKTTPYNDHNPFMKSVIIEMDSNTQVLIKGEDESGQMINKNDAIIWKNKVVKDKRKFTKLYHNGLKDFFGLGRSEMDLIRFIMHRLRKDQDKVAFTYKLIKEETDIASDSTVTITLLNLMNKRIIARAEIDGVYYINPNIFFNGDRVAFVRSYVMKQETNTEAFISVEGEDSTLESREEREEKERVGSGERGNSPIHQIENL